jgi:SAM-dependent methyltransferase
MVACGVIVVLVLTALLHPPSRQAVFSVVQGQASVKDAVRPLYKRVWYAGNAVACNICGTTARKFEQGPQTQWELGCPYCYSRPRHRTAYRFFHERTDLYDGRPKRMLHVAPEPALAPKFRAITGLDYLSGDLDPAAAMVQMDITDIRYPDNSFDVIYCSHVLEHVPDDRRAMRELARVLKPGGWAVLVVPFRDALETFEDPTITDPQSRQRLFGQWDHVRWYGAADFQRRLEEAGFTVTVDRFAEQFSDELVRRHGLSREAMYLVRKTPQ